MRKPFSCKSLYFIERRIFAQNYKFINKNDQLCAWRDFKKIFVVNETFTHIPFWPGKLRLNKRAIVCFVVTLAESF